MSNYESFFPNELDCKDDCITLMLKPGHYDILYKSNGLNDQYDIGFEDLTDLVLLLGNVILLDFR